MPLAMCALLEGCASPGQRKWVPLESVVGLSSVSEIREAFTRRNLSTQMEEVSVGGDDFFFVSSYPYSGPRIFNVYCFERIEPTLWRLRAVLLFASSRAMRVEFKTGPGYVEIVHEGKPLFRITPAAQQERHDRNRAGVKPVSVLTIDTFQQKPEGEVQSLVAAQGSFRGQSMRMYHTWSLAPTCQLNLRYPSNP
jgi:hypothetical protein